MLLNSLVFTVDEPLVSGDFDPTVPTTPDVEDVLLCSTQSI